jgi:hypothetical protein
MKKEVLNYYLYISWDKKKENQADNLKFSSYMMVAKTMIKEDLGGEIQALNDNVFVFSSYEDFEFIKNKLKHKQFPYMLMDISMNISTGLISTFLQDCEVDILNTFVDTSNKNQIDYFHIKLEECIQNEEYESACLFRDLIKNKAVEQGQGIE